MSGTFSQYLGTISVKDPTYGATGDGSTDDTAAIQAAINAAFGTAHNQPLYTGKILFFPPGNYNITSPLNFVGILGARVLGAGPGATTITFTGSTTAGNSYDASNPTWTPIIMTDGLGYAHFSDMSLAFQDTTATTTFGIYIFQSGSHGYSGGCIFEHMTVNNPYVGILGNSNGAGNCDNVTLINCQWNACRLAGVRVADANAVNWQVYGGGAQSCGTASTYDPVTPATGNSGAAYSVASGSIGVISGVSCSNNNWDIINSNAQQMSVIGSSFEGAFSPTTTTGSIAASGSTIHISGCTYRAGSLHSLFLSAATSGQIITSGCNFNPGTNNGVGKIAALGNVGIIVMDACEYSPNGVQCGFYGTSGSKLYLRASSFGASYTDLLTNFSGTVAQNI